MDDDVYFERERNLDKIVEAYPQKGALFSLQKASRRWAKHCFAPSYRLMDYIPATNQKRTFKNFYSGVLIQWALFSVPRHTFYEATINRIAEVIGFEYRGKSLLQNRDGNLYNVWCSTGPYMITLAALDALKAMDNTTLAHIPQMRSSYAISRSADWSEHGGYHSSTLLSSGTKGNAGDYYQNTLAKGQIPLLRSYKKQLEKRISEQSKQPI